MRNMTSKGDSENFKDPIDFLGEERIPGSTGELRISQLELLNWIRDTNKEINKHKEALDAYKKQFSEQTKKIEKQKGEIKKQEDKLSKMLVQQSLASESMKVLRGLVIGAVLLIVLSIVGIAYDLIRDNHLHDMYINKLENVQKEIRE